MFSDLIITSDMVISFQLLMTAVSDMSLNPSEMVSHFEFSSLPVIEPFQVYDEYVYDLYALVMGMSFDGTIMNCIKQTYLNKNGVIEKLFCLADP